MPYSSPQAYLPASSGPFPEKQFQDWYAAWAKATGIDPNPDDPRHKYDYRKAYSAGANPAIDSQDGHYHWPSAFKAEDHPNRYINLPGGGILDSLLDVEIR